MADLSQFGRTILEGIFKEKLLGLPHGDTTTRISGLWLVAGIEWFRPLLGGCIDSTDSLTDVGRNLPQCDTPNLLIRPDRNEEMRDRRYTRSD